MKIKLANNIALEGTPRVAVSHAGLFCLPMSYTKDAGLIWVKWKKFSFISQFLGSKKQISTPLKKIIFECCFFCLFFLCVFLSN